MRNLNIKRLKLYDKINLNLYVVKIVDEIDVHEKERYIELSVISNGIEDHILIRQGDLVDAEAVIILKEEGKDES